MSDTTCGTPTDYSLLEMKSPADCPATLRSAISKPLPIAIEPAVLPIMLPAVVPTNPLAVL